MDDACHSLVLPVPEDPRQNQRRHALHHAGWSKLVVLLVVLTSLSSAVVCLGVCVYTVSAVSDLQARLDITEAVLTTEREERTRLIAQAVTEELERRGVTEELTRRRRRNSHHSHSHAFVHLSGTSTHNDAQLYSPEPGYIFRWNVTNSSELTYSGNDLSLEPSLSPPTTIKINRAGLYDVYSQVAINGRDESDNHHDSCGHQTVLLRGQHNPPVVLMESRATQHDLGNAYGYTSTGDKYALDTINHRGIFMLWPGDELRVRKHGFCSHFRFRSKPTYSFFGVVQILGIH